MINIASMISAKKTKNYIVLLLAFQLLTTPIVWAQTNYPQNYFRNPLNIPISLAGNFGECRPNHFHSGMDIKTDGKENYLVFAAADGYVSRIKIEKGGFGHALYVTHPNGYTTLYAHLNDYMPKLQAFLRKMQYQNESWTVDVLLKPDQFPVKQGEQIAWSGNTGGSTAPHLHFEIRNTQTEHPLNGQLFGFQVEDNLAPIPERIAFYDLNYSIYNQTPSFKELKRKENDYTIIDTVVVNSNKMGMGIVVNDFMNGSTNTLNFYKAFWSVDDSLQGSIALDDIGYDVTRFLHAFIDYSSKQKLDTWVQLLFRLPGNQLTNLYPYLNDERGAISINDYKAHHINISLIDAYGNKANICFYLKTTRNPNPPMNCQQYKPNTANNWLGNNIRFTIPVGSLYDDVCFEVNEKTDEESYSNRFLVGDVNVPVHSYFQLDLKPNKLIPFNLRDKIVLRYSDGKDEDGKATTMGDGWYHADVRKFGSYWLTADTTAPFIKSLQKVGANLSKAKELRFECKDDLTSVKTFRAELDGKWILMEPASGIYTYIFDEHCKKGKHQLLITATDENKNERKLLTTFVR